MHQTGPRLGQTVFFTRGQVDGMAVNSAFAQQALCLVSVQIIAGLREQIADPSDFVMLLRQMRLHQAIGVFTP